ncbi:MAG: hypothetical protein LDL27_09770, partial [Desulfovibrio sp.]|nr:hypothetical protein [Desulfovibrio sp.]
MDTKKSLPPATNNGQTAWHQMTAAQALEAMATSQFDGLDDHQVRARLDKYGPNKQRQEQKVPLWRMYFDHIRAPMLLMLLVVGVLYLLVGSGIDATIVFGVVLVIATIEIVNEKRSEKAIAALKRLTEPHTLVRR